MNMKKALSRGNCKTPGYAGVSPANPLECGQDARVPRQSRRFCNFLSRSFLLLAALVMTVHVLVLHHHHDTTAACFLTVHCMDDEESHNNFHRSNHSHDSDCRQCCNSGGVTEECPLDVYLRPANFEFAADTGFHKAFQHPALPLFFDNSTTETPDTIILPFMSDQCSLPRHTDYISDSFGLRAPPLI